VSRVAGVVFTLDPESGFRDVIVIDAGYGVGETVVGGEQEPDEYLVFKPTMTIIDKRIAKKKIRMIQDPVIGTKKEQVPKKEQKKQALSDNQILKLAEYSVLIEKHYSRPMDIEWALDDHGELVILQARPETIHSNRKESENLEFYKITASEDVKKSNLLVTGQNIGSKIGIGIVRVFASVDEARKRFQNGDIIVTHMTDPDWEPWMKIASAIVTESGGRTCHAAIICRELGIPCIVGAHEATDLLKEGQEVTVDCSEGMGQVFNGILPFEIIVIDASVKSKTRTKIYMIVGEPDMAFEYAKYHIDGYGLVRLEFIINSYIGIHPLALYHFYDLQKKYDKVNQGQVYLDFVRSLGCKEALTGFHDLIKAAETVKHHIDVLPLIEKITEGYLDKKEYYIEKLAFGIARIAASIYPKKAIIRLEDLKSNEYWNLKGGRMFEVLERNTMIGFRGSSRYYDQKYRPAFDMGCEAIRRVIKEMKLDNIVIMLPFTRTPEEGIRVRGILAENGLGDVSTIVMNEVPANNILIDEFMDIFDGFSIGTNDLTQLNLALDRDSELVAHLYDERHFAVRRPLIESIKKTVARGKYTGICGQAPSDWPSMCAFLIECGISSIALNPDVVVS
ncbi:MAG: phosphoenolpyruvate synthase, partial [Bacteroidales bacterium]|nr:phosphoenolpyruvate synthase [Bacteroidales bacterium]